MSPDAVPFLLSKRQNKLRFNKTARATGSLVKLNDSDLQSFDTYVTLGNIDEYSDRSCPTVKVPKCIQDQRSLDLVAVLRQRKDGESVLRQVLLASFEADVQCRVSLICSNIYDVSHERDLFKSVLVP